MQSQTARTLDPSAIHSVSGASEYAQPSDFCRVFSEGMTSLFSLALLLTADRQKAETCFVDALNDCLGNRGVFAEAAPGWARRLVIKRAIATLFSGGDRRGAEAPDISGLRQPLDRVAKLPVFDRFVFALTVLEGYRVRDCATLLNRSSLDVEVARRRALREVGRMPRSTSSRPRFTAMAAEGPAAFEPAS